MHYTSQNVGANLAARYAAAGVDATAAGTGDNTEVNGAYIDRSDFFSVKCVIAYTATLAEGETLSIAANLQDATSAAGAGVADFGTAYASTVVATGGTGGSTETGVLELDFDLLTADQFIRLQFTPDLSAGATDVAELAAVYILGGSNENPVTASVV